MGTLKIGNSLFYIETIIGTRIKLSWTETGGVSKTRWIRVSNAKLIELTLNKGLIL